MFILIVINLWSINIKENIFQLIKKEGQVLLLFVNCRYLYLFIKKILS